MLFHDIVKIQKIQQTFCCMDAWLSNLDKLATHSEGLNIADSGQIIADWSEQSDLGQSTQTASKTYENYCGFGKKKRKKNKC